MKMTTSLLTLTAVLVPLAGHSLWSAGETHAAAPDTGVAEAVQQDQTEATRIDYLTFAQGALFVQQTGLATGSSDVALLSIDGDPYRLTLTTDRRLPVEFVYKLPASTTFDRFAIPAVIEQPGNVTFVKSVTVSGSLEGPDDGYQVLAAFELETHGPDQDVTELSPGVVTPVRWVKVRFEGGINIESGDEGRTVIWFSEIIGNGTQEAQPASTAFDGLFDLRLTERTDLRGQPLSLHQENATITGCVSDIHFYGSVNGSIARATGVDSQGRRPSSFIFVSDEEGAVHAAMSINRGRFAARTAIVDPDVVAPPCAEAVPEPKVCGANVYINFEFDSAVIRAESEPVLADVYRQLVAEAAGRVQVTGHTSTEGAADYNQALSERRAQAVVDDLVARGFEAASIFAGGEGESDPLISPDRDESSRTLNRRVVVSCS